MNESCHLTYGVKQFLAFFTIFCGSLFGQSIIAPASTVNGVPATNLITICNTNPGSGTCGSLVTTYTTFAISITCPGTNGPLSGTGCSNPGYSDQAGNIIAFAAAGQYWCQYKASSTAIAYSLPCSATGSSSGTGFPVTAAQTVNGPAGAITPAPSTNGGAEVIGSGLWLGTGGSGVFAYQPAFTGALTGGNLSTGNTIYIQITITNSLGESLPSTEAVVALNGTNNCASGNSCSITVTGPTLGAGQTYTVYSAANTSGTEKKQTASAACVNLASGVNCVIGTTGTGASPPTTNGTVPVFPGSVNSSECPSGQNPVIWAQDNVNSSFHTLADINLQIPFNGEAHNGQFEFCRPVIFNFGGKQPTSSATGTPSPMTGNGALLIFSTPPNSVSTLASQIQETVFSTDATNYSGQLLGDYAEIDIAGTGNLNGNSTPGQVSAGGLRGVVSYYPSSAPGNPGKMVGVSGTTFREVGAQNGCGSNPCYMGLEGDVFNYATTNNASGSIYVGVGGFYNNGGNNDSTGQGYAFLAEAPPNIFNRTDIPANVGFYSQLQGTGVAAWDFFGAGTPGTPDAGKAWFQGNVYVPSIFSNGPTIAVSGSEAITGSVSTAQLTTPGAPTITVVGTGGAATWTYAIAAVDGNSQTTPLSATTSTALGNATLTSSNYNNVCLPASFTPLTYGGVGTFNVYRTVSGGTPASLGLIGSISIINPFTAGASQCLADKALVGNAQLNPTINTTGTISAAATPTLGFFNTFPDVGANIPNLTYGAAGPSAVANNVHVFKMPPMPFTITVNKMVINTAANNAADVFGFGFYDTHATNGDCGNLLGSQTMTPATTGVISQTWSTPITLQQGQIYCFGQTSSGTTTTMYFAGLPATTPNVASMVNTNRNRMYLCGNASAAGVLPAICGTVNTTAPRSEMIVWFEN